MKKRKIDCKHNKMERYLEVSLLLLLSENENHGYGLIEDLIFFGFSEELNVGSLYRTLRKMEKNNLVSSHWEKGDSGPRKRVYEVTEVGREELSYWVDVMKMRKQRIQNLIDRYKKLDKDN